MNMPRIGDEDQTEAKEALRAAIGVLLRGSVENVVTVSGNWKCNASRDMQTGYHIHLWCLCGRDPSAKLPGAER